VRRRDPVGRRPAGRRGLPVPRWSCLVRTGMNSYRAAIAWLSHLERALEAADPETRAMPMLAAAAAESP
jgi:hypothetical protein